MGGRSALLAMLLATGAIAGCADDDRPKVPTRPGFVVAEQAATVQRVATRGYEITWAALVTNPHQRLYGESPTVRIIARDRGNSEIAAWDQVLDALPPGGRIGASGSLTASSRPSKVEVGYKRVDWRESPVPAAAFTPFRIASSDLDRQDDSYVVTGTVVNPYAKTVQSLAVTALLRDTDGRMFAGATSYLDQLGPRGAQPFAITVDGLGGTRARTAEILAVPWGSLRTSWAELVADWKPPSPTGTG